MQQWQRYHFYGTSDLEIQVRFLHPDYVGRRPLSEHDVQHIPLRSRYLTACSPCAAQNVPYEHQDTTVAQHSPYRRFWHQETRMWHNTAHTAGSGTKIHDCGTTEPIPPVLAPKRHDCGTASFNHMMQRTAYHVRWVTRMPHRDLP
jgi:hypothetical protein